MHRCRASINGPADPVLAGPVFLKVEMKFHFYKKQVINKGASMIFGLVRKGISRSEILLTAHALCLQGILCKK